MKTGLYCSAGHDYIAITSNGDVAPCNAFARFPKYSLGNLFNEVVHLRTKDEFFRCPTQECHIPCDRQLARKQVWQDGKVTDSHAAINPAFVKDHKRPITFLWAPTWKCNYSCVYCDLPEAKDERTAPEWIAAFTRFFDTNGIDGGGVGVTGGEPLFYKEIGSVLRLLSERGFIIQITTNLSGDIQRSLIQAVPPEKFSIISCSLHPSDKNFRWEQFRGRVLSLKAYGYNVAVNFVGHPDQVMLAPEFYDFFTSHGVTFALIPMEGEFNGVKFSSIEDYPPDMREIFYKLSPEWLKGGNRFVEGKRRSLPMVNASGSSPVERPSLWRHLRKLVSSGS